MPRITERMTMKNTKHLTFFATLFFFSWSVPAQEKVGMILIPDEARIERGSERLAARMGDFLMVGDSITATSGETVFVFCPSQEKVSLQAGSRVQLTDSRVTVLQGPDPNLGSLHGCEIPKIALGDEDLERIGGMSPRGPPWLIIYLGGPTSQRLPVFSWEEVAGAESYRVVVQDDSGKRIWEQTTTGGSLEYPVSAPRLKEGQNYSFEIRAKQDARTTVQGIVQFMIKPNPQLAEALQEGDSGELLMRAVALEKTGYYWEAAALYRLLRGKNPEDVRLTRRLAFLYWKAGLFAAADRELDRLKPKQ